MSFAEQERRARLPHYLPGHLDMIDGMDRETAWLRLPRKIRDEARRKQGTAIDWWASPGGYGIRAVALGSAAFVVVDPPDEDDPRYVVRHWPIQPGSIRSREIAESTRSGTGHPVEAGVRAGGSFAFVDPETAALLGHLPAIAQRDLLGPFASVRGEINGGVDFLHQSDPWGETIDVWCWYVSDETMTVIAGRGTGQNVLSGSANWRLTSWQADTMRNQMAAQGLPGNSGNDKSKSVYNAEINRSQPAALLLLVDQSLSMGDPWAGGGGTKAEQLALAVNRLLGNAVLLCSKGDDRIYDYFEVGILGYGEGVRPVLHGSSPGQVMVPISEVARNPRRVDQLSRKVPDGAGGLVEVPMPLPVWLDPVHNGWTPMVQAFEHAAQAVEEWCGKHRSSFPPIVVNITDGESTDGDPAPAAARIRGLGTDDGSALLFNLHLSSGARDAAVHFPTSPKSLTNPFAAALCEMSSELPPAMADAANSLGYDAQKGARGFLYNAEATAMIEFLDIGTRAVTPTGLKELTAGSDSPR